MEKLYPIGYRKTNSKPTMANVIVNCPDCGRFTKIAFNNKDKKYSKKLACEHCQHDMPVDDWLDLDNQKN